MSARGIKEGIERLRRSRETQRIAMWAALSVALGGVIGVALFSRAPELLGLVAGALLLACLGICVWAAVAAGRGGSAVERAVANLRRSRLPSDKGEIPAVRNGGTEEGGVR